MGNQHCNDMPSAKQWWVQQESEAPDALSSVRRVVEIFGAPNVFIVSKLGKEMQVLTETWLHETMDVCKQTGLVRENIHFCTRKHGKDGKGAIAQKLKLSHFVDDNFECLESIFSDPVGNSRESVEQFHGKLLLFARSGLGSIPPDCPKLPRGMSRYFACVANWKQTMEQLDPAVARAEAFDDDADKADEASVTSQLKNAAESKRSDGVVLVWKDTQDNSYLSNWAKSPIFLDGATYNCVEQWIMASKARACGDQSVQEQVMQTKNPRKQKGLGRSIDKKAVDRYWKVQQKWNVQLRGCRAKFQQNHKLATSLLQTGQKPIAEASPSDEIFGIGLAPSNPLAQDPANWKGLNLLGKALMQVRNELRDHILAGKDLSTFQLDAELKSLSTPRDLDDAEVASETNSYTEQSDFDDPEESKPLD